MLVYIVVESYVDKNIEVTEEWDEKNIPRMAEVSTGRSIRTVKYSHLSTIPIAKDHGCNFTPFELFRHRKK